MSCTIQDLINAKILSIEKIYDYWQFFTDKGMINIYNPVKYACVKDEYVDLEESCIQDLINRCITNLKYETLVQLRFEIDNKKVLTVSLAEEDYTGPEAASVRFSSGVIMVVE